MQNPHSIHFPTDYASILERVNKVDPIKYAKTRNFLNGEVTYLAPYISRGVISLPQILDVLIRKGFSMYDAEKLIQELAWREYYQRVWQNKQDLIWEDLKQVQQNVAHTQMIASLQNAQTGIKIIDESIQQFYQLGYLHNHLRMYIASIACNIGGAHWLQPSKWMYYHLLDGDIASNNCSWQWVAGSFSSKKYYCNQENINKYTATQQLHTFLDKPYESLVKMQVPPALAQVTTLGLCTQLPTTSLLKIDTSLPTLLYNGYNLDPEWRKLDNVNRVLLLSPSHFNKYPVSNQVIQFILDLSKNIAGIQVYVGEAYDLQKLYDAEMNEQKDKLISKEHPLFTDYPEIKDERSWMFPTVTGYFPSFFGYWKKCQRQLA
jgi:deoxyribodipyrimidine photo-lyase